MEMMVMVSGVAMSLLASRLIPHRLPRKHDRGNEILVQQCRQLPIHRREVQPRHDFAGTRHDFRRAQRFLAAPERVKYGLALAGISFHAPILMQINLQ